MNTHNANHQTVGQLFAAGTFLGFSAVCRVCANGIDDHYEIFPHFAPRDVVPVEHVHPGLVNLFSAMTSPDFFELCEQHVVDPCALNTRALLQVGWVLERGVNNEAIPWSFLVGGTEYSFEQGMLGVTKLINGRWKVYDGVRYRLGDIMRAQTKYCWETYWKGTIPDPAKSMGTSIGDNCKMFNGDPSNLPADIVNYLGLNPMEPRPAALPAPTPRVARPAAAPRGVNISRNDKARILALLRNLCTTPGMPFSAEASAIASSVFNENIEVAAEEPHNNYFAEMPGALVARGGVQFPTNNEFPARLEDFDDIDHLLGGAIMHGLEGFNTNVEYNMRYDDGDQE